MLVFLFGKISAFGKIRLFDKFMLPYLITIHPYLLTHRSRVLPRSRVLLLSYLFEMMAASPLRLEVLDFFMMTSQVLG